MKIKLCFLLAVAFNGFMFSQSYKIIYEFKWKVEQDAKDYNSELTALITGDGESYFEALTKFKYDSLKTEMANQGLRSFPAPKDQWRFQPLIIKDVKNQNIKSEYEFFDKIYLTKYTCKHVWKIYPEKTTIFGYNAQKAETNFGGRKWIAWFTNEIPINEGPYKFYGLPGLILDIKDSEDNFLFNIKALSKEKNSIDQRNRYTAKVNLTPKQWEVFWEKYKSEPSMIFANLNEPNQTFSYVYNGKNVDSKEAKDSYNKAEKEKLNHFKIPLELQACE